MDCKNVQQLEFVSPVVEYAQLMPPKDRPKPRTTAEWILSPFYNPVLRIALATLLFVARNFVVLVENLKNRINPVGRTPQIFRPAHIYPRTYWLSTYFDFETPGDIIHTVEKLFLRLRSVYTLFHGQSPVGEGVARLFSLGAILDSAKQIDCYDAKGKYVGHISGSLLTTSKGKFHFYDAKGAHTATSYVSGEAASIYSPDDKRLPIATLRKKLIGNDYHWRTDGESKGKVDPRILEIFAGFVTDAYRPWKWVPRVWSITTTSLHSAGSIANLMMLPYRYFARR